jgi:uncharacterized membrane protein YbhN (UPF0104 family)
VDDAGDAAQEEGREAMTTAATVVPAREKTSSRLRRIVVWVLVVVVIGALAYLLGWDISGWFADVWDTITEISIGYLIAGVTLKTVQTTLTAYAWYSILRYAYPGGITWLEALASYAASVALNGILPANIGTLVMLLMFTTIISGATFAGILGAYAVQKIFFTAIGIFVYLYLFLSVGGSFDIKFAFVHEHPWATAVVFIGGAMLIFLLIRRLWAKVVVWWDDAKEGGGILAHPRAYFLRVFTPSLLAWIASLGVMSVFMAAYDIPVTFNTLMRICGGNSIANVTSVTPGGAGVTQAFNVASLKGVATSEQATAYSVAQQLVTTTWNILFGIAMVVWAFGWSGGKKLVGDSYEEAKQKAADQKAAREERKRLRKEAKEAKAATG